MTDQPINLKVTADELKKMDDAYKCLVDETRTNTQQGILNMMNRCLALKEYQLESMDLNYREDRIELNMVIKKKEQEEEIEQDSD